jgi:hypothetical protein
MADGTEDTVEGVDPPISEGTEGTGVVISNEPTYTEAEQQAMAQGWVPKDQYSGTGRWRSAEDFLDRGELFATIDSHKRRADQLDRTLNDLKKHYKKVSQTEYNRALSTLREEKIQALDNGDTRKAVEIDEQIAEAKEDFTKSVQEFDAQPAQPQGPAPEFVVWVARNSWYQNDPVMKGAADAIGDDVVAKTGERNPTKILLEVERRIKQEFPHKFNNANRGKPGTVEGGGSKGGRSEDAFKLNDDEKRVMEKFVKHGVLTRDEYIRDIKAQRGE